MVSQVRDLLHCPEGIRIIAVHRDDLSYIEYWDGEQLPRILFLIDRKAKIASIQQLIVEAIGTIPPSACGQKKIELQTDIKEEDYTDGIKIGIDIFEIEIKDIDNNLLKQLRGRHDFNDYMSRIKEAQASASEISRVSGD